MREIITRKEAKKRLLRHVLIGSGCWLWIGNKNYQGYGVVDVSGKKIFAHRLSYYVFSGYIKKSKCVCHRCDKVNCINPAHLFLGSQQDNLNDMRKKGRERGLGYINRKKTHCLKGHPLFGKNLRLEGKAMARRCIKCETENHNRRRLLYAS